MHLEDAIIPVWVDGYCLVVCAIIQLLIPVELANSSVILDTYWLIDISLLYYR